MVHQLGRISFVDHKLGEHTCPSDDFGANYAEIPNMNSKKRKIFLTGTKIAALLGGSDSDNVFPGRHGWTSVPNRILVNFWKGTFTLDNAKNASTNSVFVPPSMQGVQRNNLLLKDCDAA